MRGFANKLTPEWDWSRDYLIGVLMGTDQWKLAQEMIAAYPEDTDERTYLYFKARLAAHENRLDEAESLLLKVIMVNPESAEAHYALGTVYMQQDKLSDARASFREALRYPLGEFYRNQATRSVAQLNEKIGEN